MTMKVAVIGCGHWGKNLVRNFAELDALSAISDPDKDLANKLSSFDFEIDFFSISYFSLS